MDTRGLQVSRWAAFALVLACLLVTVRPASSLARWIKGDKPDDMKTDAPIDEGVRNCIVRVGKAIGKLNFKGQDKFFGPISSGIIIRIKYDDGLLAKGADIWVLTSDHGTRKPQKGGFEGVRIGFGDQTREAGYPNYPAAEVIAAEKIKDPGGGKPIDLSIVRVRIDDVSKIPDKLTPPVIGEVLKDQQLILAGYGRTSSMFDNKDDVPGYLFDKTIPVGTLRSGYDKLNALEADHQTSQSGEKGIDEREIVYKYDSLVGRLEYGYEVGKDAKMELVYYAGDGYVLGGDSGGPTLQKTDDKWTLVGIHSESENPNKDGKLVSGSNWWDVDLSKYKKEIEKAAGFAAQPEPQPLSLSVLVLYL